MAKSILGVEIGSSRMKIAEYSKGRLQNFVAIDLPDNIVVGGQMVSWDAMVGIVKDAIKSHGFSSRQVALVVPENSTVLRRLTLPAMTEAQLKVNLPYEFHDLIADDKEKYIYDYAMVAMHENEEGQPMEMELLGAAVSKELMENYTDMFRRAGLKLVKAEPRELAIAALMRRIDPDYLTHDSAILDLGSSTSTIDIFHNGVYEVTRTIDIGMDAVHQAVAEALNCDVHIAPGYLKNNKDNIQMHEALINVYDNVAIEVMRAMNYYSFENPDNTLDHLHYFGGGAWVTPFVQEIANNISLQMVPLSELRPEETDALIDGAAAIGVCFE